MEERSAAFFALGRIKATGRPVAVITTSGTAAGELLPAAMEAFYSGLPLVMVTADRPRRYRGSGAPQSAEQVGLFGIYAPFAQDLQGGEGCDLIGWDRMVSCHLNVCLEECYQHRYPRMTFEEVSAPPKQRIDPYLHELKYFISNIQRPLVVVGMLHTDDRAAVAAFLLTYRAPVYFEAQSGLREDPRFAALRIPVLDSIWQDSAACGYPIEGVLRIGGVPTARVWRDLEDMEGRMRVCSVSRLPFSGLSWSDLVCGDFEEIFSSVDICPVEDKAIRQWRDKTLEHEQLLHTIFAEEPAAEPSLLHKLSKGIDSSAVVYLGNSLPIREWDLAASMTIPHDNIHSNRGVNGIDGQLSTFFGVCDPARDNWGIVGDLTAMYDMAAPWILSHLDAKNINIVVVNNGGGKIFGRIFKDPAFQNCHSFNFEGLARMWNIDYECWDAVPDRMECCGAPRLIELCPDDEATARFWKRWVAR